MHEMPAPQDLTEDNPAEVKKAEIVVGMPSYNEADAIGTPTREVDRALREFFPDREAVIVNCDNASTDGTREIFLSIPTETPKIYLSTPGGILGKGHNIRNLLQRALHLDARCIAIVDADVRNITPHWVRNLVDPLFRGIEFVSPLYVRHPYEAPLTNNIIYPLTRSLYGTRLRDPIGGECAISARLAEALLAETWDEYVTGFGINIWLATQAMIRGVPIGQAFLGGPKVHKTADPDAEILPLFSHTVGTVLRLMEHHPRVWKQATWSKPTAIFGLDTGEPAPPEEWTIDARRFHQRFTEGFGRFARLWKRICRRDVFHKLDELTTCSFERFEFPTLLWTLILFDCALARHRDRVEEAPLLESLMTLYFGVTCSNARATAGMNPQQVEVYVEDQCAIFEDTKRYLLDGW